MSTVRKLEIDTEQLNAAQVRRRIRRSRQSSINRRYLWLAVWTSWIITIAMAIYFNWIISVLTEENHDYKLELSRVKSELEEIKPNLAQANQQISSMVEGALPDLSKLEFDKVIALDNGYLKHVVFTQLKKRDYHLYEYKLVVQNNSLEAVRPLIDILLFDERGIQLGSASIGRTPNSNIDKILDIGETYSYTSIIQLARRGGPAYFMISRDYDPDV